MQTVAKFITNVGAPPFTFVATAFVVGYYVSFAETPLAEQTPLLHSQPLVSPMLMSLLVALCGGVLPLLLISFLRIREQVTSLDLDTAKDRIVGFSIALGGGGLAYALLFYLSMDQTTFTTFLHAHLTTTLLMFVLTTITMHYNWKASVHSAGASCLMYLSFYFEVFGAVIWAPLLLFLISWSRLHLSKHTLAQVLLGMAIGISSYAVFFRYGKFFNIG